MNIFKVTYTDGTHYTTNANGTLAEFTAYLMQFGGIVVDENPVTGKETRRQIEKVEQVLQCLSLKAFGDDKYRCVLEAYHEEDCHFERVKKYQIIKFGNVYRADEIINDVGYFSHHCGDNITALVAELEAQQPKPEVTFDDASRLDFYRSL